jgi:outer membrane lipoprotein SlyB
MRRIALVSILIGAAVSASILEAQAQNRSSRAGRGAVVGGLTGAAIGGLAGGGRGAAIGTLAGMGVGSVMGRNMEHRRGNYYWFDGRCWVHSRNGEFHPVASRYCR